MTKKMTLKTAITWMEDVMKCIAHVLINLIFGILFLGVVGAIIFGFGWLCENANIVRYFFYFLFGFIAVNSLLVSIWYILKGVYNFYCSIRDGKRVWWKID